MDGSAVLKIKEIVEENETMEVDGKLFARGSYRVVEAPVKRQDTVRVNTLQSFSDFIKDQKIGDDCHIVVSDNMSVTLYSGVDEQDKQRTMLIEATNDFRPFSFNQFLESEDFNIMLQTRFVYEKGDAISLFKIMSTIQMDEGITVSDDGKTQNITVRRGMSAASDEKMDKKSRVSLSPYRIFPECDQPMSEFLHRIKGNKEKGAYSGLWETDGGMWKFSAKSIIFSKLREYGVTLPIYC
jgi:hypothetical protein